MKRIAVIAGICALGLSALAEPNQPANKSDEIIVTATRTENQVKDISGNVTIIGPQEIKESNAHTVDELLKTQGGLDIQGGSFMASKIRLQMRGLPGNYGAQRTLIMMDGRPINEEYMGDVDFRFLPLDNVARIEIVRGPASALYGSNAVGGVINIITKTGKDTPLLNLKSTTGSFNTYGTVLEHSRQINSFNYFISAGQQTTDGYLLNSDNTPKNWSAQNVSAQANWNPDDESKIGLALGINNGIGIEENFKRVQDTDYLNLSYQTRWLKDYDGAFTARVYRNGLAQDLEWKFGFTGSYEQSTLGVQIQQSLQPAKNHFLTLGVDTKQQDALVKETNGTIDETVNSQAVYAQDEIGLSDAVIGTLGLRYDQHDEFGSQVSPRLGLVYHFNEQTSVRVAAGKGYREPTVSDMFLPLTPYGPITFQGNANLKPETLWSYELGLDHKFNTDLSVRLTLFQSELQDAWDYMRDADNIYRPNNITRLSIQGLEAETKYHIANGLDGFANYTYTDAKYDRDENKPLIKGNHVEEVPRNQGNLGVRFQPENSNAIINFTLNGAGERYTDPENTRANKLFKYMVATAGVSSNITKTSSFFATVHNLFDREYKETIEYYQPGRWFETGFSIHF